MNKENRRYKRIDEFLKRWAKIAKSNPNIEFNTKSMKNAIYNELIRLGVDEKDKSVNLRDTKSPQNFSCNHYYSYIVNPDSAFNNWLQHFDKNNNIDVFVSPNWSYFCQFVSKDKTASIAKDHIKVYIPLDAKHIEEGAKQIFDFLSNNNIPHLSKIGKNIRFDDIVIRLVNKEDADKLINFVNNNKYIQNGLIEANPFAFNNNGIALACDGNLSYNDTIAGLIDMYIGQKKRENALNTVGLRNFYSYLINVYQKQFIEHKIDFITREFEINPNDRETLNNYENVIRLVVNSQNPTFTYDKFIEHYEKCSGKENKKGIDIDSINNMIIETINTMSERFNSLEDALINVEVYVQTGQKNLLTRQKGLRDKVTNSNFRESLRELLKIKKISFRDYYKSIASYQEAYGRAK